MAAALASVLDFQSQSFAMMSKEEQQAVKTCFHRVYLEFDVNQQWNPRR